MVYIESSASVLEKINSAYIPVVIARYIEQDQSEEKAPKIKAALGKNSSIINLSIMGEGEDDDQLIYFSLLAQIVEALKADHQRMYSVLRKEFELSSNKINNQIQQLKEQGELLRQKSKRLDDKESLLEARIINTRKLIRESEKSKQEAVKKTTTEGKALALMMIENDLRQANNLLASLEVELRIELHNQRDSLANQIKQNERDQNEQQDKLS
ncbi:MAG: hypothetical protein OEY87_07755, partial [Gammaproteobacteria bacterium]|nr:hypothetical protein [Gammaproteobacteria bacterium]